MGTGAELAIAAPVIEGATMTAAEIATAEAAAQAAAAAAAEQAAMQSAAQAAAGAAAEGTAGEAIASATQAQIAEQQALEMVAQEMAANTASQSVADPMVSQMTSQAAQQGAQVGAQGAEQSMGQMLTNNSAATQGAGQTVQPMTVAQNAEMGAMGSEVVPASELSTPSWQAETAKQEMMGGNFQTALSQGGGQAAGTYAPNVTGAAADPTYLGLTQNQWQQQLIGQGIAAGLQYAGNSQSQDAQDETTAAYYDTMNQIEAARMAELEKGMAAYTPENMSAAADKYRAENDAAYNANNPGNVDTSSYLGVVAPQSVKDDYTAAAEAGAGRAKTNYDNLVDMKAMSALLGMNADSLNQSIYKANMQNSVGQAATAGYGLGMQQAGQEGQWLSGAGSLVGGLGNLVLANQVSKGTKPSSISNI